MPQGVPPEKVLLVDTIIKYGGTKERQSALFQREVCAPRGKGNGESQRERVSEREMGRGRGGEGAGVGDVESAVPVESGHRRNSREPPCPRQPGSCAVHALGMRHVAVLCRASLG